MSNIEILAPEILAHTTALRDLRSSLRLADLASGAAPEWAIHLAAAQLPGALTEGEIARALGVRS